MQNLFTGVDIGLLAVEYFCLLFSLCVHEASHAAMANWCGDPSARMLGRLTLNPVKHIDPLGTIVMPLIMLTTNVPWLIGWAKPVPFNPRNLHNIRRDPVLIAIAGPLSNLLIALAATIVLRLMVMINGIETFQDLLHTPSTLIVLQLVIVNLGLMLFNFLPVPPLDGHYILNYFLPYQWQQTFQQLGPFALILVVMVGGRIIGPPLMFLYTRVVAYGLSGAPF